MLAHRQVSSTRFDHDDRASLSERGQNWGRAHRRVCRKPTRQTALRYPRRADAVGAT